MVDFKTVKDINLHGKRVLLRADYNVPMSGGRVSGDYRILQSIPNIEYILAQKPALLVIISHLGRPEGKPDKKLSLAPVARELAKQLKKTVHFVPEAIGESAKKTLDGLEPGSVALLENVRFYPGEKANEPKFAKQLIETSDAEIFVQDGFGVVHRKDASTDVVTELLPSVGGLLLEKEVAIINRVMTKPDHPLTAIVGGAKISDKIAVLQKFIGLADCVAVVGALANNFLVAQRIPVGKSLIDKDNLKLARDILELAEKEAKKRPFKFLVPVDGIASQSNDGHHSTRVVEFSNDSVRADEGIYDVGPESAGEIAGAVKLSRTVIWSGTCGMAEIKVGNLAPFAHATKVVAEAITDQGRDDPNRTFSVVGGGDTTSYVETEGWVDNFSHVSTGGSASLELMAGNKLPGIEALKRK